MLHCSNEEAGRYLETYKSYENKPADILQEKVDGDHHSKVVYLSRLSAFLKLSYSNWDVDITH